MTLSEAEDLVKLHGIQADRVAVVSGTIYQDPTDDFLNTLKDEILIVKGKEFIKKEVQKETQKEVKE